MDNSVVDAIIDTMFREHPVNDANEIEFSIVGQKGPGSPWNMGISKFRNLLTGLRQETGLEPELSIMLTVNVDSARVRISDITEIQKFCVKNDPPLSHPSVTYENKMREAAPIDITEHGLRLRFASEQTITDVPERQTIVSKLKDRMLNKFYRYAQRYSIVSPKKIGEKGQLRVDFTSVRQNPGGDFRQAQLTGPGSTEHDRYEVEVDLSGLSREEVFQNEDIIRKELQFFLGFLLRKLNGGMTIEPASETLLSLNKYLGVVGGLMDGSGSGSGSGASSALNLYQSTMISLARRFITVNITTMGMKHIVNNANGQTVLLGDGDEKKPIYTFTDKADGLRSLLFIDETGKASLITRSTIKQTRFVDGKERQSVDQEHILEIWPTGLKYEAEGRAGGGPHLLDGEFLWIKNRPYFLAFDILVHKGANVTQRDFVDRLALIGTNFNLNDERSLSVQAKQFYNYTIQTFKDLLHSNPPKLVRKMDSLQLVGLQYNAPGGLTYDLDGLVFQPRSGPESYFPLGQNTWPTVFKWKPTYMSTLDLRLIYDGLAAPPTITKTYEPTTLEGRSTTVTYAVFKAFANRSTTASPYMCCSRVIDGVPRTESEDGNLGEPIRKGMIVECRLSVENVGTGDMHWVPVRIRHDKSQPNDIRVYTDLVNTVINEPITLDNLAVKGGGRGGSTQVLVNTVNRDISNKFIVEEINSGLKVGDVNLLDLGCGTLKSATAWTALTETRQVTVLGVDEIDVGQANINLRGYMKKFKSKFSAEFVHGNFNSDLTTQPQTSRFMVKPERFNVVTCTFAIHYSMATEDSFRTFVKNVSRNLAMGGLFIGAYMNKSLILEDMKTKNTTKIGGSVDRHMLWQIQLVSGKSEDAEAQTFGAGIKVSFTELYQNHVEYLINMEDPTVKRILAESGLVMKKHQPFNSYGEASRLTVELERQWLSYHYMFVFEKTEPVSIATAIETEATAAIETQATAAIETQATAAIETLPTAAIETQATAAMEPATAMEPVKKANKARVTILRPKTLKVKEVKEPAVKAPIVEAPAVKAPIVEAAEEKPKKKAAPRKKAVPAMKELPEVPVSTEAPAPAPAPPKRKITAKIAPKLPSAPQP